MKKLLFAATALTLFAAPAHAQLLGGGGGLTGGLGSAIDLNSTIARTTDTLRSTTRGTIAGSAATEGDQSVDRRNGRIEARRSAQVDGTASVAQLLDTPISAIGASGSGNGSASGSGEAQAQLLGTDAVRATAGNAVGRVRGAAGSAANVAAPLSEQALGTVPTMPGGAMPGASAGGQGSGEGQASLMSEPLAVAGSAAAAARGAAAIAPGMPVLTPGGLPLGEVREIVANSRGQVEQIVVEGDNTLMSIPAGNLSANGEALIFGEAAAEASNGAEGDEPTA